MFKNHYKVCISGHNIKGFIKMLYKRNISLSSIKIYDNFFYTILDESNFEKLSKIKTSYKVEVINTYGFKHFKELLHRNSIFLFSVFIGILLIYFLSFITFDIEIMHSDSNIRNLLKEELLKNGIKKYSIMKNYNDIQKIKDNIIENNKNEIEWIEIKKSGTKYIVRVEKRIINEFEEKTDIRHVVAKKSGIIKKIVAEKGEIVRKINDYVTKGDILISGEIHKGENILDNVSADGDIYAEVWYKVRVSLPINYSERKYTNIERNTITINFLNNQFTLFGGNNFKNKEVIRNNLFSDFFDLFQFNYNLEKEIEVKDEVNLMTDDNLAVLLARNKIEEKLKEGEYIISQKKLKTILNNSTINVEVFFKVYENISLYQYYEKGENNYESTVQ